MPIQTKTDQRMPTVTLYRLVSAEHGQVIRFTALGEQAEESLLPIMQSAQARIDGYHGFLELLLQARYPHDGLTRFHLVPEAVADADLTYHCERVIHWEEKGDIDDSSSEQTQLSFACETLPPGTACVDLEPEIGIQNGRKIYQSAARR